MWEIRNVYKKTAKNLFDKKHRTTKKILLEEKRVIMSKRIKNTDEEGKKFRNLKKLRNRSPQMTEVNLK